MDPLLNYVDPDEMRQDACQISSGFALFFVKIEKNRD